MEISKMLTLSTGHIEPKTAKQLDNQSIRGLIIYNKSEYGWFINLLSELIEEVKDLIPKDLLHVIHFALDQGCEWLCLDRDGAMLKELPVYDW